jgi:uncharacterized membrane protein
MHDHFFFHTLPFFEFSLYEMCFMFIFWSFVGWCLEVVTMTIQTGEYQNRGFLNMPICPIYGCGVILAVVLFRPISHTWVLLFFLSAILCTLLELIVGLVLEKLFQNRWWDYSMFKFNFMGLICLWVTCGWGIGCIIVIKFIQPSLERFIDRIPVDAGCIFLAVMAVLIILDLVSSIRAAINLNIQLKKIDELSALFLKGAQGLGKRLAGGTQKVMGAAETAKEKAETVRENVREKADAVRENVIEKTAGVRTDIAEKVSELRTDVSGDLRERLDTLINTRNRAVLRLLRAFPTMRSRRYMRALRLLQRRFKVTYIPHPADEEFSEQQFQVGQNGTVSVDTGGGE